MMPIIGLFASNTTATCPGPSLFDIFPTWYEYLPKAVNVQNQCVPSIQHLTDIWLIVAAVIEIMLRLSALVAVIFVIYGGVMYTTSQGSPDQTSQARSTIINALIGLVLSMSAAVLVAFLAESF